MTQSPGHRDPLPLAAGKALGGGVQPAVKFEALEEFEGDERPATALDATDCPLPRVTRKPRFNPPSSTAETSSASPPKGSCKLSCRDC